MALSPASPSGLGGYVGLQEMSRLPGIGRRSGGQELGNAQSEGQNRRLYHSFHVHQPLGRVRARKKGDRWLC